MLSNRSIDLPSHCRRDMWLEKLDVMCKQWCHGLEWYRFDLSCSLFVHFFVFDLSSYFKYSVSLVVQKTSCDLFSHTVENGWLTAANHGTMPILPACVHTHTHQSLSHVSLRTQSKWHFTICFHLWLDIDLILQRKHKGTNKPTRSHLKVAWCNSGANASAA